jgi:hypothetical protein
MKSGAELFYVLAFKEVMAISTALLFAGRVVCARKDM